MKERPRVEALQLLGLARRAGAVVPGTDAARRAVRQGEARLVLMAGDASSVQLKKIRNALKHRPIPQGTLGDRATLGAAVGRGPVSAVAVTAASFAEQLQLRLGIGGQTEPNEVEE
jgi:ribosomal protein L7Ae-like RNA K-turn-binding protein